MASMVAARTASTSAMARCPVTPTRTVLVFPALEVADMVFADVTLTS